MKELTRLEQSLKQPIPGRGFLCECYSILCLNRLTISRAKYLELRSLGLIVLPEHVKPGEEKKVIDRGPSWAVIGYKNPRSFGPGGNI
jgi:hypothetical protein